MATALVAKSTSSSTIGKASSLFLLRNLSTTTTSAGNEAADGVANKPKRKKNLFEVAQFLPNWGIGYHMAKSHWNGLSYEITKINLYKDGRHGKAWGVAHKNGAVADASKKRK